MTEQPQVIRLSPWETARLRQQVLKAFVGVNRLTLRPLLELLDQARAESDNPAALAARIAWHLAPLAERYGGTARGELGQTACALARFALERFPQWLEIRAFLGQRLLELSGGESDLGARRALVQEAVATLQAPDPQAGGAQGLVARRADALCALAALTPRVDRARALLEDACECYRRVCDPQTGCRLLRGRLAEALLRLAARLPGAGAVPVLREGLDVCRPLLAAPGGDLMLRIAFGAGLLRLAGYCSGAERQSLLGEARQQGSLAVQAGPAEPRAFELLYRALLARAAGAPTLERQALLHEVCARPPAMGTGPRRDTLVAVLRARAFNEIADLAPGPDAAERRRLAAAELIRLFRGPTLKARSGL